MQRSKLLFLREFFARKNSRFKIYYFSNESNGFIEVFSFLGSTNSFSLFSSQKVKDLLFLIAEINERNENIELTV